MDIKDLAESRGAAYCHHQGACQRLNCQGGTSSPSPSSSSSWPTLSSMGWHTGSSCAVRNLTRNHPGHHHNQAVKQGDQHPAHRKWRDSALPVRKYWLYQCTTVPGMCQVCTRFHAGTVPTRNLNVWSSTSEVKVASNLGMKSGKGLPGTNVCILLLYQELDFL